MGKPLKDESGNVYGRLTVIERAENKDGRAYWKCRCECGKETIVSGKNLRNGLIIKPSTVSKRPPIIEAPMIAPYERIPPPITPATELNTPINPELVPMMIGTLPPHGPIEYN